MNECTAGTAECDNNAFCTDTTTSYGCICNDGYTGDGFTCGLLCYDGFAVDIENESCVDVSTCSWNNGWYECVCDAGFDDNYEEPRGCEDVNECDDSSTCESWESCTNTFGSYSCDNPNSKYIRLFLSLYILTHVNYYITCR